MSKAGCKGNNGENWLLRPGTSSQSGGYSSKWLIWLVCREPLDFLDIYITLLPWRYTRCMVYTPDNVRIVYTMNVI